MVRILHRIYFSCPRIWHRTSCHGAYFTPNIFLSSTYLTPNKLPWCVFYTKYISLVHVFDTEQAAMVRILRQIYFSRPRIWHRISCHGAYFTPNIFLSSTYLTSNKLPWCVFYTEYISLVHVFDTEQAAMVRDLVGNVGLVCKRHMFSESDHYLALDTC